MQHPQRMNNLYYKVINIIVVMLYYIYIGVKTEVGKTKENSRVRRSGNVKKQS